MLAGVYYVLMIFYYRFKFFVFFPTRKSINFYTS